MLKWNAQFRMHLNANKIALISNNQPSNLKFLVTKNFTLLPLVSGSKIN